MSLLDRIIGAFSPEAEARRVQYRAMTETIRAHYSAAGYGRRAKTWVPSASDADGASLRRQRLAHISRDMLRNTPYAARAQQVIANNVVGDGIIPKAMSKNKTLQKRALELFEAHLDTTAIDADGLNNLYGLQRIAIGSTISDGEVLVRKRRRRISDGFPLPFQIQLFEADYIDSARDGSAVNGNLIREGIEFDKLGRRVAYYLFDQHPGARVSWSRTTSSRRVPAEDIIHLFRQDRPGQNRGVSWYAATALNLQDLGDHQDAQLMRQKIAACFAAFRTSLEAEPGDDLADEIASSLQPGAIMSLAPGEDIRFGTPPGVDGFDEFTKVILRSVAAGLGITYEALTGDLSNVNFSSARMGRMEMDRNISSWQWTMMIPQFLDRLSQWFMEAWMFQEQNNRMLSQVQIRWVPPHRVLVDPTREIPALGKKVELGLASRSSVIRDLGYDPERVIEEIAADAEQEKKLGLRFGTSVYEQETTEDE
jgi:lambda family phage portal protein